MTASTGDLRLAIRGLLRSPLFAIVATLSLALGIGANTAIFTLMDQILLRTLPAKDPDRLVMLYQQGAHNGSNMGTRRHSYPVYQDLQRRAGSDEARHAARVDLDARRRSARALGASVRAPQAGIYGRNRCRAAARVVHANSAVRDYAGCGEGLVGLFARSVPERKDARDERRDRILAAAQRLLHGTHRPDVHGRSRAADRVRERRQPADRARVHAPERALLAVVTRLFAA